MLTPGMGMLVSPPNILSLMFSYLDTDPSCRHFHVLHMYRHYSLSCTWELSLHFFLRICFPFLRTRHHHLVPFSTTAASLSLYVPPFTPSLLFLNTFPVPFSIRSPPLSYRHTSPSLRIPPPASFHFLCAIADF